MIIKTNSNKLFDKRSNHYYYSGELGKTDLLSNEMLLNQSSSILYNSFNNDPLGYPLKSTQQIPIDYSKFENHTFFNSAEANVNMAFNSIINEFPFDGSKEEIEIFLDSLTGFEKWVYSNFSKNKGYLKFNSNSYLEVEDKKGVFLPALSKNASALPVIMADKKSISFQFDYFHPANINSDNYVIFQKINNFNGISLFASQSLSSENEIKLVSIVSSSSLFITASIYVEKNKFNHITFVFDKTSNNNELKIFNGNFNNSISEEKIDFGNLNILNSNLLIGSGSKQIFGQNEFIPKQIMTGALDDFRVFHESIGIEKINKNINNTVFPIEEPNLVFLQRYNEPTGSYSGNRIVLDYSGNGLHTNILNFSTDLRVQNLGIDSLKTQESFEYSPVLFPTFTNTIILNQNLLVSASNYDANNPSLITKLIPRHFLIESTQYEGFNDEEANTGFPYETKDLNYPIPGSGKIGSPQIISAFLFTAAKQFDEYKIYLDHFSKLLAMNYDDNEVISDQLINFYSNYFGVDGSPFIYQLMNFAQYYGKNNSNNEINKKELTAKILKRLLVNYQDILRSKGTKQSIESVFRAIGINPDTSIKIREFGGIQKRNLAVNRRKTTKINSYLNFSGSNGTISSPYLYMQRVEPGYPEKSNTINDNLITSSSFTIESKFCLPPSVDHYQYQSLMRLNLTSSNEATPIFNIVAQKEDLKLGITGSVFLLGRTIDDSINQNFLRLNLNGINVFDGSNWYLNFSRNKLNLTSSYELVLGKNDNNSFAKFVTSSIFNEIKDSPAFDLLSNINSSNSSGSFITVGTASLPISNVGLTSNLVPDIAKETKFSGQLFNVRFFSKKLENHEIDEHIKNPKSVGVIDPIKNFGFNLNTSGSFERLRLNIEFDENNSYSNNLGNIFFLDFSNNFLTNATGSNFNSNEKIVFPKRFDYSIIEPKFDESIEDNKVVIRSLENPSEFEIKEKNIQIAPIHKIDKNNTLNLDNRLSIEISLVKSLDEDIVNILSTLESIEKSIGGMSNLYSIDYKDIEKIREIYFNRLTNKINYADFLNFYNWFDSSIENFIAQLLPMKTKFLGTNFLIESHILERHKISYKDFTRFLKLSQRVGDGELYQDSIAYTVDSINARLK